MDWSPYVICRDDDEKHGPVKKERDIGPGILSMSFVFMAHRRLQSKRHVDEIAMIIAFRVNELERIIVVEYDQCASILEGDARDLYSLWYSHGRKTLVLTTLILYFLCHGGNNGMSLSSH